MLYIIIKNVRKDDYIVDKSSIIIAINFQCPIYKTLYIKKRVREFYKDHLQTFYSSLINKNESIMIIEIYKKLKKEIRYINRYNTTFSINQIDNILLKE